MEQKELIYRN